MPNWCQNIVRISGLTAEEKAKIKRGVEEKALFTEFRPRPENIGEGWHEWSMTNWGTKWDVTAEIIDESDDFVVLTFDSAWTPPIAFYDFLVCKMCIVEAYYMENGGDFAGRYSNRTGDQTWRIDRIPSKYRDNFNGFGGYF